MPGLRHDLLVLRSTQALAACDLVSHPTVLPTLPPSVDVVQAVGRVMRRAEGKRYGYVIIPVRVAAGEDPEAGQQ